MPQAVETMGVGDTPEAPPLQIMGLHSGSAAPCQTSIIAPLSLLFLCLC